MNAQKKVLADQLNARDSSGPKTATRKSNSRRNATKAIDDPHVNKISPGSFLSACEIGKSS